MGEFCVAGVSITPYSILLVVVHKKIGELWLLDSSLPNMKGDKLGYTTKFEMSSC